MSLGMVSSGSQSGRILVVDDDPLFTTMAQAALSAAGHDVRVAADGVEALELLRRNAFDIALIDLSMPRIDGLRLIGLIRGMPRHINLAIMVVTSSNDKKAFAEAATLRCDAYQIKPVDWAKFPLQISELLAKSRVT